MSAFLEDFSPACFYPLQWLLRTGAHTRASAGRSSPVPTHSTPRPEHPPIAVREAPYSSASPPKGWVLGLGTGICTARAPWGEQATYFWKGGGLSEIPTVGTSILAQPPRTVHVRDRNTLQDAGRSVCGIREVIIPPQNSSDGHFKVYRSQELGFLLSKSNLFFFQTIM